MRSFFSQKGNSKVLIFEFEIYMRSKSSFERIRKILSQLPHLMNKNVKDKPEKWEIFFLYQRSQIVDLTEISAIRGPVMTSFWVKDTKKWYIFCVWSRHFCLGGAPATPLKSATLWGSCSLKTTLVVFVAKNCWFYQNLKKPFHKRQKFR